MKVSLFRRRTIWWPTGIGWSVAAFSCFLPLMTWWFTAEEFFSINAPRDADVLVVEAWISSAGIRASVEEFKRGKYRFIVVTGGLTGEKWSEKRWDYAVEGEEQLLRAGIKPDQMIVANNQDVESRRTYEMARAASAALRARGINPHAINVFTRGTHARRSRLIFSKAFDRSIPVGVVVWRPENSSIPWWQSSERSEDLLKETVGYLYELILNPT
jgi:uncharacterized SAM-binding protein YcdF (DUF218 family)